MCKESIEGDDAYETKMTMHSSCVLKEIINEQPISSI